MAKRRTKVKGQPKVAPLQYWIHEESGRVGLGRGEQHAKEKREAGFREVGPATFKRYVMEAQEARVAALEKAAGMTVDEARNEAMAAAAGLV